MGSIRKRVDDANFNILHGRHEAALALLLIAIDGSALKVYPEGTKSIKNPRDNMRNKERYTRFLGVRLCQVFGCMVDEGAYFWPVLPQFLSGIGTETPQDKIYTDFRCNELHESGLPEDLRYAYAPEGVNNEFSMEFCNGEIRFSSGLLRLLESVITGAPCNGAEFDIHHYRLKPKNDKTLNELQEEISKIFDVSLGRIGIVIALIQLVGPAVRTMNDNDLSKCLTEVLDSKMPGGCRTGLCMMKEGEPICNWDGGITSFGVSIVRFTLNKTRFVDLSNDLFNEDIFG